MKALKLISCLSLIVCELFSIDAVVEELRVVRPPLGYGGSFHTGYSGGSYRAGGLEIQIASRPFDVYLTHQQLWKTGYDQHIKSNSFIKVELIQANDSLAKAIDENKPINENDCKNAIVLPYPNSSVTINGFDYTTYPYFNKRSFVAKLANIVIPDAKNNLTFRITYTDGGGTYYRCNSAIFTVRPKEYALYNFAEFDDAFGNKVPIGIIGAKHISQTTPPATYTKNTPIREGLPVLKAGKEYPSIGLVALDFKDNIITSYNGTLKNVIIGNPISMYYGSSATALTYGDFNIDSIHSMGDVLIAKRDVTSYGSIMLSRTVRDSFQQSRPILNRENASGQYAPYMMSEPDCGLIDGFIKDYGESKNDGYYYTAQELSSIEVPNQTLEIGDVKFQNGVARNLKMPDGKSFKYDGIGLVRVAGYQDRKETSASFEIAARNNISNGWYQECLPYYSNEYELQGGQYKMIDKQGVDSYMSSFYRCYAVTKENQLYFIPDHIEISNFKIHNFESSVDDAGMTYIRSVGELGKEKVKVTEAFKPEVEVERDKDADMYATLSFDMEMKTENNKVPLGYTRNCYARDIDVKLDLIKAIPELEDILGNKLTLSKARDAIGYFNDPYKGEYIQTRMAPHPFYGTPEPVYGKPENFSYERAEKKEKDEHGVPYKKSEGYFTVKADSWKLGRAHVKVRINFDRNIGNPIKPFEVTSDMFNITEIKDTTYGKGMEKIKTNSFTAPQPGEITRAKFYYGMAYSPNYKALAPDTINTTTYFGVYCGECDITKFDTTSIGKWERMGAMSGWYINTLHNQKRPTATKNFGYVSKYELPAGTTVEQKSEVHNVYTDKLSFYGKQGGLAIVTMETQPWLVYAPGFIYGPGIILPTSNNFKLAFTGAGYWAGKSVDKEGKENTTGSFIGTEIQKSNKSSNRINW